MRFDQLIFRRFLQPDSPGAEPNNQTAGLTKVTLELREHVEDSIRILGKQVLPVVRG